MGNGNHYFYFLITLDVDGKVPFITSELLRNHVSQALKSLYGEVGCAIQVDVMKFEPETFQAVLRCPAEHYVKVHSSLTLCGNYKNMKCAYRVHKVSPCLISLLSNSRMYIHD